MTIEYWVIKLHNPKCLDSEISLDWAFLCLSEEFYCLIDALIPDHEYYENQRFPQKCLQMYYARRSLITKEYYPLNQHKKITLHFLLAIPHYIHEPNRRLVRPNLSLNFEY